MSFQESHDWSFPVPIAYGPGRLGDIADFCRSAGMRHPLIVTDQGSVDLAFMHVLKTALRKSSIPHDIFAEVAPNPRDIDIENGCRHFRTGDHDGIIAIGGGSGMDGGKAIALTAKSGVSLWEFEFEQSAPELTATDFPPLITIPTTAGTGAETESTAMITDTQRAMKWCVWHSALKPHVAILDPLLTIDLPPHLTAWTGVDAMVHAIEAYCVPDCHPLCDGIALQGLRLVADNLPAAYRQPENVEARGAMLTGSCLAGISFMKGLGLVHALSHMIGAEFDTQHGLTNAVLLPSVLRFNASAIHEQIIPMAQAMQLKDTSFDGFHGHICQLLDDFGIPENLHVLGVTDEACERLAEKALQDSAAATNPRPASQAELVNLLQSAMNGIRSSA